jgi:hypothetical protein
MEGFAGHFFASWLRSSLLAFLVGLPTAIVIAPFADRVTKRFIVGSK